MQAVRPRAPTARHLDQVDLLRLLTFSAVIAAGRFQGQRDPALAGAGWAQARHVGDAVAALGPVAVVVSSDLRRARQTARVVARRAGVPLVNDRRLREVALGRLEGLDRIEAARRYPHELERWLAAGDARPAGGEMVLDAGARAAAAIQSHLDARRDGTVVVVPRGIVLQAALRELGVDDARHLANGGWLAVASCDRPLRRRRHGAGVRSRIGAPSRQARMSSTMSR